ncbi:uracil-DNA glycosylase [Arthrobacter sp. H5]|uniref:uracil-DNA glycosylase n=1 Tax=Arthrobacter sp. H5 TaxID=1267973 RepID=UPI0020A625B9|nr:uracil-DNA glycosylase [Arthrobacter sp. H5]
MARRMADPAYQAQQWERRYDPNIEEINRMCDALAVQKPGRSLPYIDPIHDLDECRIVSLFSSPGHDLISGFVSSENDDQSAIRTAEIYEHVGLSPKHVMPWNVYPWYVEEQKERALTTAQIDEGVKPLLNFLQRVSRASALVAHGTDAHKIARRLTQLQHRAIVRRGFKIYPVRSVGDRAFAGSPEKQELWLREIRSAYTDAMARAGISRSS